MPTFCLSAPSAGDVQKAKWTSILDFLTILPGKSLPSALKIIQRKDKNLEKILSQFSAPLAYTKSPEETLRTNFPANHNGTGKGWVHWLILWMWHMVVVFSFHTRNWTHKLMTLHIPGRGSHHCTKTLALSGGSLAVSIPVEKLIRLGLKWVWWYTNVTSALAKLGGLLSLRPRLHTLFLGVKNWVWIPAEPLTYLYNPEQVNQSLLVFIFQTWSGDSILSVRDN